MVIIKTLLFHILLSFRGLILAVSKFLSFVFLGGFLAATFITDLSAVPMTAKVSMASLGILFILLNWFYDYLIFYFKPRMLDIMLIK